MSERYIYTLRCPDVEEELCRLEARSLFGVGPEDGRVIFASRRVSPHISPYLRSRLEVKLEAPSFSAMVAELKELGPAPGTFKVDYVRTGYDDPSHERRNALCKEAGMAIRGTADLDQPSVRLGILCYKGSWFFGALAVNNAEWRRHITKPHSYSSSLGTTVAKALVNVAGGGDLTKKLVDPCCGAGTVLLEGLFAGYDIEGWEMNRKIAANAKSNLLHFGFPPKVACGAIQDITAVFDAAIVDLPYGIMSRTSEEERLDIIRHAKRIAHRVVLVSTVDVANLIEAARLKVLDFCTVRKASRGKFVRSVWVCEPWEA